MKRMAAAIFLLCLLPAQAALYVGASAPDFTAPATLGGKEFVFHLQEALSKGPVVVYFYPAAFTEGCTIEAHEFAEAMPAFTELGASVIGVSYDNIATLDKFSVSACQSRFPVAADPDQRIMKSYKATMGLMTPYADRVSYVIGQDGKIVMAYSDLDPDGHVLHALKALRALAQKGTAP